MSVVRSLTIEKQAVAPAGGYYEIPRSVPEGVMILNSARVDILLTSPNDYSSYPKSVSLEFGTIIGGDFVLDNSPASNWFKVVLDLSTVTIGADTYLSSTTYPETSFKMSGDLANRFVFKIRDQNGTILDPAYFLFHFSVVSPF